MARSSVGFVNENVPDENKKSMFVSRENIAGDEPTSDKLCEPLASSRPSLSAELGGRSQLFSGWCETGAGKSSSRVSDVFLDLGS